MALYYLLLVRHLILFQTSFILLLQARLLQAELHYLNGDVKSAQLEYKASISAAHNHKFPHYKALACELHGIFCLENQMIEEGTDQLKMALDKYNQWGAKCKVRELEQFMKTIDPTHLSQELKIRF